MEKKIKILVVDDNIDTVELLRKRLRVDGYDTEGAHDGEEGLNMVLKYKPDVIVLDVMMPKKDGYEVCEELKKSEATRHIPILMLTAKSEVSDKVKGLDIGADAYIAKPFDYKEVAASIRSLITLKKEKEKLAEKEKFSALDQMVDEVSHEVRNPLMAIGGLARRMRKEFPEGSQNRIYLDIMLHNVEMLEKMVDQLIELKSATLSYAELSDINEITLNALKAYDHEIERKHIKVITHFMENPPLVPADRENITKAIAQIIENGIECMEGERQILTISTSEKEGFFEIQISDTGRGIAKDTLKNIYDPFFTSKTYGPGLGLTFTLKTIQSHNGIISVESTEGKGTIFTIRLPIKSAIG